MPRIESGSSGSSEGFSIPFKAVALVTLIACGLGYMVYQYVRLHPKPQRTTEARVTPGQVKKQVFEKLALSNDQKEKLAQLERTTTNPQQLKRNAYKVLTDDQKKRLKDMRAEAQAKQVAQKAKRQERMNKYFPGGQRQVADAKQKELQARNAARRAAANAAAPAATH